MLGKNGKDLVEYINLEVSAVAVVIAVAVAALTKLSGRHACAIS
jgi:hypothetical protein